MRSVDIGFVEECELWKLQSQFFPSKVGGKPAWLALENLPTPDELQCTLCSKQLTFLCQIYAPYEDDYTNFHRTLFVFICRNGLCCRKNESGNIKVFRSQLPRRNKFYPYTPAKEDPSETLDIDKWTKLCQLCGCFGEKRCSKCNITSYCCKDHQVIDWKEAHKAACGNENSSTTTPSAALFNELDIVIEAEDIEAKIIDEEEQIEVFNKLEKLGKTGTLTEVSEEDLQAHAALDQDKVFSNFKKKTSYYPSQILRYEKGGAPLWISAEGRVENVPDCEHCGSERQFEFQIMPQLISMLKEDSLDWGIIAVYTCKKSCCAEPNYKMEFIVKQDVSA